MSAFTPLTLRPALAELPARPLNHRPKPAATKASPAEILKVNATSPLTPPSSPPQPREIKTSISTDCIEARPPIVIHSEDPPESLQPVANKAADGSIGSQEKPLKRYSRTYLLQEELGHGVWSKVYKAIELSQPVASNVLPFSPPTSPSDSLACSTSKVLAVKKPSRRDACKILEEEARMLTYLHSNDQASSYVIGFHGFDAVCQSVVLDAVPLNLENYVKSAQRRPLSTKTMFDPIIGAEQWTDLLDHLIDGLSFLHTQRCVHGDIKAANILLRIDENDKTTPLYCDFSSSRIAMNTLLEQAEEVSAVTADFTAPELLQALQKRDNRAVATYATDIFALAVTMLFTATAESPYACARMDFQRLGMAKEGTPLEYAKRGQQASRIMSGRAVERALKGGLAREPEKRVDIEEWKIRVHDVRQSWRDGGWSRGG